MDKARYLESVIDSYKISKEEKLLEKYKTKRDEKFLLFISTNAC